jgi:transposase
MMAPGCVLECRSCGASLDGAAAAGSRWAQVIDVEFIRKVTEWALPGLSCPCCERVTFAGPPAGAHACAVSYGPALNAAAVLLTCYGNVPPERTAQVIGMLLGIGVSAGWVDKAAARVSAQLGKAGFDAAMIAALAGEGVLAADETPVNVPGRTAPAAEAGEKGQEKDPEEKDGKAAAEAPHVLITRTPDGRLTLLQAMASRRKAALAAGLPATFTGYLITADRLPPPDPADRENGITGCGKSRQRRPAKRLGIAPQDTSRTSWSLPAV